MIKHFAKGAKCPSKHCFLLLVLFILYSRPVYLSLGLMHALVIHTYSTQKERSVHSAKKGVKVQPVVLSFPASGLPLDHLHKTPRDFFFLFIFNS